MAVETVNTLNDGRARYRQVTLLDGESFVLYFRFNSRDAHWYLDVNDADDEPISGMQSLKLVLGWSPGRLSSIPERPAGVFFVLGTEIDVVDPGIVDLGVRVLLQYVTANDEALA